MEPVICGILCLSDLLAHVLDDLGEGGEDGGALPRTLDDVVDGVGERRLLEAAVNVPTGAADLGATAGTNVQGYPSGQEYALKVVNVALSLNSRICW